MIPHLSLAWWIAGAIAILSIWLFEASFRHTRYINRKIIDLSKVDQDDLQIMLGGMFFKNTFMYGEITIIKNYRGKFELEYLKDGFDMLQVIATKSSLVSVNLEFMNARQDNNECAFYLLDGHGNQHRVIDIYGRQSIFLDKQSRFGLKLVVTENYEITQDASLTVTAESWTK